MDFQVKAVNAAGAIVALRLQAEDERDARLQAATQGLSVLTIRSQHRLWVRRGDKFPLLLFSQELRTLLEAGLSLVEALEALAARERNMAAKVVEQRLIEVLREGKQFSQALRQFPAVFSELYVAVVTASEKTGDLGEALSRFIAYRTMVDAVKRKVLNSSIYPLLLLGVGGLVVLFLMFFVVPRFSHVYEDMGRGTLPLFSRWLLAWGQVVEAHTLPILFAILVLISLAIWFVVSGWALVWIEERLWRIPNLRARLLAYQLSRFYRTVGMLLRGGVPLVTAMGMAAGLLRPFLRPGLERAIDQISAGRPMSRIMEAEGLATPVALRMLAVGERAGNMGEMMERIAAFHEQEIAQWIDWFTKMFEPLLMVFIGLVIGGIVILMYMPIFELAGNIQ